MSTPSRGSDSSSSEYSSSFGRGDRISLWTLAKKDRYKLLGGVCEVCNEEFSLKDLVGHHIVNKSAGGSSVPENLELRCRSCETKMHRKYPDGNRRRQDEVIGED